MTKEELIEKVASVARLSKADAARAVNATIGSITSALKKGECPYFREWLIAVCRASSLTPSFLCKEYCKSKGYEKCPYFPSILKENRHNENSSFCDKGMG
jgi:hypothetical protein